MTENLPGPAIREVDAVPCPEILYGRTYKNARTGETMTNHKASDPHITLNNQQIEGVLKALFQYNTP